MKYRKLRVAWSVAWGVLAVLLCVLWVRSIWRTDSAFRSYPNGYYQATSDKGGLVIFVAREKMKQTNSRWIFSSDQTGHWVRPVSQTDKYYSRLGIDWYRGKTQNVYALPYYYPLLLIVALAAAAWFPYRFSLRTLLIATTLVAVVLGIIVWMSRAG